MTGSVLKRSPVSEGLREGSEWTWRKYAVNTLQPFSRSVPMSLPQHHGHGPGIASHSSNQHLTGLWASAASPVVRLPEAGRVPANPPSPITISMDLGRFSASSSFSLKCGALSLQLHPLPARAVSEGSSCGPGPVSFQFAGPDPYFHAASLGE